MINLKKTSITQFSKKYNMLFRLVYRFQHLKEMQHKKITDLQLTIKVKQELKYAIKYGLEIDPALTKKAITYLKSKTYAYFIDTNYNDIIEEITL